MKIKLIDIIPVHNELGEGVIWDSMRQKIWWTDIAQCKLYSYQPRQKNLQSWDTPERLCCFAPVHNSDYLIAAFASGFAYYHPEKQIVKWIEKIEESNRDTRLNDGRTDRQGRFWAGTMVEKVVENDATATDQATANKKGTLYCLNHDLHVTASIINNLSITNSLCWSPDSTTMYHCDTPNQSIEQYQFDPDTALIGERRTLLKTQAGCNPDGSIVDAQGFLWNAQWGGSKVVRYAPNGEPDFELTMPVSQPSCVAFAGEKLDLLVVTSAHQDLSVADKRNETEAGNLFIYQTDCLGLIESPFKPNQSPDDIP